jgi:hypothetical protein
LSPVKGEVEYDKIQSVLEKIEAADITKYGEQPALSGPPVGEFFITLKDWQDKLTKKHLAFGSLEGDVQPVKNDDYGTIVYAPASMFQDIQKAITEIKPKPPTPAAAKPK